MPSHKTPALRLVLLQRIEAAMTEILAALRAEVVATVRDRAVALTAAAGDEGPDLTRGPPGFVDQPYTVFNAEAWDAAVRSELRPLLADVVTDSAGRAAVGYAFDVTDPGMAAAVSRHIEGIASWGEALREDVGNVVETGMREGWSIDRMTDELGEKGVLSDAQARNIARTEATAAANAGTIEGWRASGIVGQKRWLATGDGRTRPTHVAASGQTVPLDGSFSVGASTGDYPGDPALAVQERVNCRCTMVSVESPESPATEPTVNPPADDPGGHGFGSHDDSDAGLYDTGFGERGDLGGLLDELSVDEVANNRELIVERFGPAGEDFVRGVEGWTRGVDDEIRDLIRDRDPSLSGFFQALDAAGPTTTDLYRGMHFLDQEMFDSFMALKPGDVIPTGEFSSFSSSRGWAGRFTTYPEVDGVMLHLERGNASGLNVAPISNSPGEREWFVPDDLVVDRVEVRHTEDEDEGPMVWIDIFVRAAT